MGTINNILNAKINDVEQAAFLNFGDVVNIGYEYVEKVAGGSSAVGDCTCVLDFEQNIYIDPDVNDTTKGVGAIGGGVGQI